jgi:catechol 2,3-dioxygenase-like lactoylglutathione lyase family enzyme
MRRRKAMKRLHVHVAVPDIEQSIRFYSTLFGADPVKVKPDYAKWMLDDPRVNFAISTRSGRNGLDHLGFQVESDTELGEVETKLRSASSDVIEQTGTACCYAESDKYWVQDPAGIPWEAFHTLGTVPVFGEQPKAQPGKTIEIKSACCAPAFGERKSGCC